MNIMLTPELVAGMIGLICAVFGVIMVCSKRDGTMTRINNLGVVIVTAGLAAGLYGANAMSGIPRAGIPDGEITLIDYLVSEPNEKIYVWVIEEATEFPTSYVFDYSAEIHQELQDASQTQGVIRGNFERLAEDGEPGTHTSGVTDSQPDRMGYVFNPMPGESVEK